MEKKVKDLLESFINNEDFDEGTSDLRSGVKTLKELRYILAIASQEFSENYDEILEALISLE